MTTYTFPAYVITSDANFVPNDAFTSQMEIIVPNGQTTWSYDLIRVENFDGLGDANVVTPQPEPISMTANGGAITIAQTNYHAIYEIEWGGGNRSIVVVASAEGGTRVGYVIDGDPFPAIASLSEYYAWVDTFSSLSPVSSGPFAPGQQISYAGFPGVTQSENALTIGGPGDDILIGDVGNNAFDGQGGTDTAVFSGSQDNYTLEIRSSGLTLEDRRIGGEGRDTIANVEFLDFGSEIPLLGGPLETDRFDSGAFLSPAQVEEITELYIAYFNRAPDAVGLLFWANAYAEGTALTTIAALFNDQPETRATYPASLSNADIVTAVYSNVLGRASDQAGFDFWVDALNSGGVSRDQFILSILEGARADPPAGASQAFIDQQLADQAYLENKTDIGQYFAVNLGMSDVDNARAVMSLYNGSPSTIDAAVSAADGFYAVASADSGGEFLMPLIGVVDSPF